MHVAFNLLVELDVRSCTEFLKEISAVGAS